MRNKVTIIICAFFSSIVLLMYIHVEAQTSEYGYGFLNVTEDGLGEIIVYSPENLSVPVASYPLSFAQEDTILYPYQSLFVSPNGEWAATVLSSTASNNMLYSLSLINTINGIVRDIGNVESGTPIEWSNDSRYIAYVNTNSGASDVFLYDLTRGINFNLTDDVLNQSSLAWHGDSNHLALVSDDCGVGACEAFLHVYNVQEQSLVESVNVSTAIEFYLPICNLTWSPNHLYISFVAACASQTVDIPKEVYLWDIESDVVRQITGYTLSSQIRTSMYNTLWISDEKLLIGAQYVQNSVVQNETVTYQVSTQETTMVASETFSDLTSAPDETQIAYFAYVVEGRGRNILTSSLQIASFMGNRLNNRILLSSIGCNLEWSPNGEFLAYATNCRLPKQEIIFVDVRTGLSSAIDTEKYNAISPIGWVLLNGD